MSKVSAEPGDEATGRYRELIRQNAAFSRALYVALQAGTETAAGMTTTVRRFAAPDRPAARARRATTLQLPRRAA